MRARTPSPRACSRGVPRPSAQRPREDSRWERPPWPSPGAPTPWCPLPHASPRPHSRPIARPPKSPPEGRSVRGLAPCAPNPAEPLPACARWGGLRALGVQAQGVGSPLPPPLTSRRPSPQVSERGATRAPRTGAGLTFPAREALLAEEEEAGEGRALCLPRVLPRLQRGSSPSPSRPPELWSNGAGEPRGRGRRLRDPGPPPPFPLGHPARNPVPPTLRPWTRSLYAHPGSRRPGGRAESCGRKLI